MYECLQDFAKTSGWNFVKFEEEICLDPLVQVDKEDRG